jgi:hypothetical protein
MGIYSFAFYFPAPPSSVLERADLVLLYFLAAAYQVHCLNLLTATTSRAVPSFIPNMVH